MPDEALLVGGNALTIRVRDVPVVDVFTFFNPLPPSGNVKSSGKRGRSNKRVSNAKLRAFGWSPQFPTFAEAMENSILPSFAAHLSV